METTPEAAGDAILPPDLQPLESDDPAEIGGHRLAGRLASTGMGVVYLARDRRGGLVAVKTTHTDGTRQAQVRRRLRTEAACAQRLPSFCTANLLVNGTDQSRPYLISEYVEGPSLEQLLDTIGPLGPVQITALAAALARALAAIHEAGLVHCELKPAHILIAADGPRVMDFGIAQEMPASCTTPPTWPVTDSSEWTAPERVAGGPATPASDVFGWGCLIGYAASGRSPIGDAGTDAGQPATEFGTLDEPVRSLVSEALARDPAERPTAGELLSRLGTVGRTVAAQPPTLLPLPGNTARLATNVMPRHSPGPTVHGANRTRQAKMLAMASMPVALAAACAVIATTGSGQPASRHLSPRPDRAATPAAHDPTGLPMSDRQPDRQHTHQHTGTASHRHHVDHPGEHTDTSGPNALSAPRDSAGPGPSTAPISSPAASPPSATQMPSPTPSPTPTTTG